MSLSVVLEFTLRQGDFTLELHERLESKAIALFGPSGSGKTTVLEAVAGLRCPKRGEIRVGDRTWYSSSTRTNLPSRVRRVGYVPQDMVLFPHINVRRNILYGTSRGSFMPLMKILELLELKQFLKRRVDELSGGERQRVALARALMSSPDLLLLDEPLVAMDAALRGRILPYLSRVRDEFRIPLIYVSHNESEVWSIADWVMILERGRVTRSGHPEDVLMNNEGHFK